MTTRVTCKLKLHVLLPWECALQNGTRIQIVWCEVAWPKTHDAPAVINAGSRSTATDSLQLNQQEFFYFSTFKLCSGKWAYSICSVKCQSEEAVKGTCLSAAEPYFTALDSAAAVWFAPVCPAVLIMLDLASEEFVCRLSEYLQIRLSAINSAAFRHDLNLSICWASGSDIMLPLWPAVALAFTDCTSASYIKKAGWYSCCIETHI